MEARVWRLLARVGDREQRLLVGADGALIGSSPECDHVLSDPTVSRRHVRLVPNGEALGVEDLGSRNGTRIDGARLAGHGIVHTGQRLRLGDVELLVERIAADDSVAAIGAASAPADTEPGTPAASTMVAAGVVRFCLREMEPLLIRAAAGIADEELAALAVNALVRAQIGLGAAIHRDRTDGVSALIACAGRLEGETTASTLGEHRLHVHGVARDDRPGVESVARMLLAALTLADRSRHHAPPQAPGAKRAAVAAVSVLTSSPALQDIYRQAARLAPSRLNVLITGESGTGKELLARHLHEASGEPDEVFLVLNCAALPADLLDAELFGIEAGIATGVQARAGRFELAHGGTVFLDEIGDMSLDTQSRILRVLQEKQVYRVGTHKPRPADVRIIAATHRDLPAMVEAGTFRLDLYHRIADWRAELPTLRDRRQDIPGLAALFLARSCAARGVRSGGLSKNAVDALCAYSWPGNVRELEREMSRLALFIDDGEVVSSDLLRPDVRAAPAATTDNTLTARLALEERRLITEALVRTGGQVEEAARGLGVSKATLYRRLAHFNLGNSD